jgi:hypothetical protein
MEVEVVMVVVMVALETNAELSLKALGGGL